MEPSSFDDDMDLENNPEFLEFVQNQNPLIPACKELEDVVKNEQKMSSQVKQEVLRIAIEKGLVKGSSNNDGDPAMPGTQKRGGVPPSAVKDTDVKAPRPTEKKRANPRRNGGGGAAARKQPNVPKQGMKRRAVSNNDEKGSSGDLEKGQLRIEIVKNCSPEGLGKGHVGQVFVVTPVTKSKGGAKDSVKIGRSTGHAMKTYGVSLHKDTEVSTSHAIITKNPTTKTFVYKDMGSSNGSHIIYDLDTEEGEQIEKMKEYEITNGMYVQVGQSVLKFNFDQI